MTSAAEAKEGARQKINKGKRIKAKGKRIKDKGERIKDTRRRPDRAGLCRGKKGKRQKDKGLWNFAFLCGLGIFK